MQNRYNLVDRSSDAVLRHCTEHGIGFIPWAPADAGNLAQAGNAAHARAVALGATPAQVALAWLLQRSSVMVPIPGRRRSSTSRRTAPRPASSCRATWSAGWTTPRRCLRFSCLHGECCAKRTYLPRAFSASRSARSRRRLRRAASGLRPSAGSARGPRPSASSAAATIRRSMPPKTNTWNGAITHQ